MSTIPLVGLRQLLLTMLPSSTSFTLPVLPTPDAIEFHLSPPCSPVQSTASGKSLDGKAGLGRGGQDGARASLVDDASALSTAELLAPNAGGSLRTAMAKRKAAKSPHRVVLSRVGGGGSAVEGLRGSRSAGDAVFEAQKRYEGEKRGRFFELVDGGLGSAFLGVV